LCRWFDSALGQQKDQALADALMHGPLALREFCVSYANNLLRITTSFGLLSPASHTRFAASTSFDSSAAE
jgi:hypothetical protein